MKIITEDSHGLSKRQMKESNWIKYCLPKKTESLIIYLVRLCNTSGNPKMATCSASIYSTTLFVNTVIKNTVYDMILEEIYGLYHVLA